MSLRQILDSIDAAARLGSVEVVVFSGGECFLLGDDLNAAIRHCTELGLKTRCVSNGYWARSMPAGRQRLQGLVEAGLTELNLSTGDFHEKWVPVQAVVNAALLGVELGLRHTSIAVETRENCRITAASIVVLPEIERLLRSQPRHAFAILESPWMPMTAEPTIKYDAHLVLDRHNFHLKSGCDSIFQTLAVTPDQRVGVCCGLAREKIASLTLDWHPGGLDAMLNDAARDFMKIWLYIDGPERILAWAASKDSAIAWEGQYAHHCHACLRLFEDERIQAVIKEHGQERVGDVLTRYYLALKQHEIARGEGVSA
jgi:hypothetical protein